MSRRPRVRIGPFITLVLVVTEIALVWSGVLGVRRAVLVGVVIEVAIWITALSRLVAGRRRFAIARNEGSDRWRAAEDSLAELMPRPLAHFVLLEPRLWVCLGCWVLHRHDNSAAESFSYHRQLRPLLIGVAALVALEGAVVDTVLMIFLPGSVWAWAVLALHLYALVMLGGLYASFVTRPHLVYHDRLLLRDGVFHELEVPRSEVTAVSVERRPNVGRSGFKADVEHQCALLALGDATIALKLDPTSRLVVDGSPLAETMQVLSITVDYAHAFVQILSASKPN